MHHVFTNHFQVITMIEKFIANNHIYVRSRPYGLGNKDRFNSKLLFLTCGNDHVDVVTNTVKIISEKQLLPGQSSFCPFDVFQKGEASYKRILSNHNRFVNETRNINMTNGCNPDQHSVLN